MGPRSHITLLSAATCMRLGFLVTTSTHACNNAPPVDLLSLHGWYLFHPLKASACTTLVFRPYRCQVCSLFHLLCVLVFFACKLQQCPTREPAHSVATYIHGWCFQHWMSLQTAPMPHLHVVFLCVLFTTYVHGWCFEHCVSALWCRDKKAAGVFWCCYNLMHRVMK